MQLYNFNEPSQIDMTQAYNLYMPVQQDATDLGLNELADLNEEEWDLMSLADGTDFDDMTEEMQQLFFKKVGRWFKKTGSKVVNGVKKAIPVVKKVVGGAAQGLGVANKVAGAAGFSNPYLSTATSMAGKANGIVNGRLQEMYDDEELMALQEAGFDLNELEEMSPEMQDLFFKKIGRGIRRVGGRVVRGVKKAVPVVRRVVGGAAKGLGVASKVAGAAGISSPHLAAATSMAGKANGIVNGRLQEMDETVGYSPEELMALQAQGLDLNELFGEDMEELDTEHDLDYDEIQQLLEIGGFDFDELEELTEEQKSSFWDKMKKAWKTVSTKVKAGAQKVGKFVKEKVLPGAKKIAQKVGGAADKAIDYVAEKGKVYAPIAAQLPNVGPAIATGWKGVEDLKKSKDDFKAAARKWPTRVIKRGKVSARRGTLLI